MSFITTPNVRVRPHNISPSNLYAPSPYKPTALLDPTNPAAPFFKIQRETMFRAVSPYAVGDKQVRDAIAKKYNVRTDEDKFRNIGIAGGVIGATVAVGVTAGIVIGKISKGMYTGGTALLAVPEPTTVTKIAGGILIGLAAIGTAIAGYMAGKAIAQMAFTPEGRIYGKQYIQNLGSSIVNRPITAVFDVVGIAANILLSHYGGKYLKSLADKNKFVGLSKFLNFGLTKWTLNISINRGLHWVGGKLDDLFFGEMTPEQQMNYTSLMAISGDFRDVQQHNPILRTIATLPATTYRDVDVADKLASAYGMSDEYKPFRFSDVRQAYEITTKSAFLDGIIDMFGESLLDTGTIIRVLPFGKESNLDKVSEEVQNQVITEALNDPNSEIRNMLFEFDDQKLTETARQKIKDSPPSDDEITDYVKNLSTKEVRELAKKLNIKTRDSKTNKLINVNELRNSLVAKNNKQRTTLEMVKKGIATEYLKDSKMSAYFFKNKVVAKNVKKYLEDYMDPSIIKDPKAKAKVIENNEKRLNEIVDDIAVETQMAGGLSSDPKKVDAFKNDLKAKLKKTIEGNYETDKTLSKAYSQSVEKAKEDLVKIEKIIKDKEDKVIYEDAQFSIDSLIINEIVDNGKSISPKRMRSMIVSSGMLRIYNEIQSAGSTMARWLNPTRALSELLARKGIAYFEKKVNKYTVKQMDEDGELLKEQEKEMRELEKELEASQAVKDELKNTKERIYAEKVFEKMNNKQKKAIAKLNSDLARAKARLQIELNKKANAQDKKIIKKLKEDVEKYKQDVSNFKENVTKTYMANDKDYQIYIKEVAEVDKKRTALEARLKVLDQKIDTFYYVSEKDPNDPEKTKQIKIQITDKKTLEKAKERYRFLKQGKRNNPALEKKELLTQEEKDEMESLGRAIKNYHTGKLYFHATKVMRKRLLAARDDIDLIESVVSRTKYLVRSLSKRNYVLSKPLPDDKAKKLKDITIEEYSALVEKAKQFKHAIPKRAKAGTEAKAKQLHELTAEEINNADFLSDDEKEKLKDFALVFKDLDDDYKKLINEIANKTTESTQEDIGEVTKKSTLDSKRDLRKLSINDAVYSEFESQMKEELNLILGEEAAGLIWKDLDDAIKGDKLIELSISYAAEFFSFLNMSSYSETDAKGLIYGTRFLLNDPELHYQLEERIKNDNQLMDILKFMNDTKAFKKDFTYDMSGLTDEQKKQFKRNYTLLLTKTQEIIDDLRDAKTIDGKNLITKDEYEVFSEKKSLQILSGSLLNTYKKIRYNIIQGRTNVMSYERKLSEMTENDILQYLYERILKTGHFKEITERIDNNLKGLNDFLVDQYEKVKKRQGKESANLLYEQIRRELFNITNTNVVNALSSPYMRRGGLKAYQDLDLDPFTRKPIAINKPLDVERIIKDYDKRVKETFEEAKKIAEEQTGIVFAGTMLDLLEKSDGLKQLAFAMGVGNPEQLKELFLKVMKEEIKAVEVDKLSKNTTGKFDEDIIDKHEKLANVLMNRISKHRDLTNNQRDQLKSEILNTLTQMKNLKVQVAPEVATKIAEADAMTLGETTNKLIQDFQSSIHGEFLDFEQIHFIVRGSVDSIDSNIAFDPQNEEDIINGIKDYLSKNEIPSIESIQVLQAQEGIYKNKKGVAVHLRRVRQLTGHNGIELPEEWKKAEANTSFQMKYTNEEGKILTLNITILDNEVKAVDDATGEEIKDPKIASTILPFFKGVPENIANDKDKLEDYNLNNYKIQEAIRNAREKERHTESKSSYTKIFSTDSSGKKTYRKQALSNMLGSNSVGFHLIDAISKLHNNQLINDIEISEVKEISLDRKSRRIFDENNERKTENVTTKYRVMKFTTEVRDESKTDELAFVKQEFEIFVPEMEGEIVNGKFKPMTIGESIDENGKIINEGLEVRGAYRVNGNLYLNQRVFNEDSANAIAEDLLDTVQYELSRGVNFNNRETFVPYKAQQKAFNIFYDQRKTDAMGNEEIISDFVFIDDKRNTEYQIMVAMHGERMTDNLKQLLATSYDSFKEEVNKHTINVVDMKGRKVKGVDGKYLKDQKYSLRSVPTNPNVILRNIRIKDKIINEEGKEIEVYRHVPINDIYLPFNRSYGIVGRSSLPAFSLGQAKNQEHTKTNLKYENALVQTKHMEHNPHLREAGKIGLNLKVKLYDYYDRSENSTGATTHEDVVVVPARKELDAKGKWTGKWIHASLGYVEDGMKLMNRHTSKHTIKIEDIDQVKHKLNIINDEDIPELIISRASVPSRELSSFLAELHLTKNHFRNEDGSFSGDVIYVDNDKNIQNHGISAEELELALEGYSYFAITDTLTDGINEVGYKSAGDLKDGIDGATIGIEELLTFAYTSYLTNGKKNLDQGQLVYEFIKRKTMLKSKAALDSLYEDRSKLTGKAGIARGDFFSRKIANSGYNKIMANTKLVGNQAYIPLTQAIAMGIWDPKLNNGLGGWVSEEARQGVIFRYPTQGRRSFIQVEYLIDPNENSKVLSLSLGMHELLNADHDGDGMAHFSLKGASKKEIEAFKEMFSHNYSEDDDYSDMAFYDRIDAMKSGMSLEDYLNEKGSFALNKRVNRDSEEVFLNKAKMNKDETTGEHSYSEDFNNSFKEFTKAGVTQHNTDEDFDDSYLKQYTLKDYSGKLTGEFDFIDQWHLANTKNQDWFNKVVYKDMSELTDREQKVRKFLEQLGIRDFYSLTSLLKDFYSQKTFDFSKHGREEYRKSFEVFYNLVRRRTNESFQDHITRVVLSAGNDIIAYTNSEALVNSLKETNINQRLDLFKKSDPYAYELWKKVKGRSTMTNEQRLNLMEKLIMESYINKLTTTEKNLTEEFNLMEKEFEKENLSPKFSEKISETKIPTNRKFLKNEIIGHMKNAGLQTSGRDYDSVEAMAKELEEDQGEFNYINLYRASLKFQINSKRKQAVKYISDVIGDNESLKDDIINPIYREITNTITNLFKGKYLLSPEVVKDLYFVTNYTNDKGVMSTKRFRLIDILQANGRQITEKNFATYLSPSMIRKFNISINEQALDFTNEDLDSFHFESLDGFMGNRELELINDNMKTNIEEKILDAISKIGTDRNVNMSPMVHNQIAYKMNLFFNAFNLIKRISVEEQNDEVDPLKVLFDGQEEIPEDFSLANESPLVSLLFHTKDVDNILKFKKALTPYLLFQTISKYINNYTTADGSQEYFTSNVLRELFESSRDIFRIREKGLRLNVSTITDSEFTLALANFNMLDLKDRLEFKSKQWVSDFVDMFKEYDEDIEKEDVYELLIDVHSALKENNRYGAHTDFFMLDPEEKIKYLAKIYKIRTGHLLTKENANGLQFEEDDFASTGKSSIEYEDRVAILDVFRKVEDSIRISPHLNADPSILEAIKLEKLNFTLLNKVSRELGRGLNRYIVDQETRQNVYQTGEDGHLEYMLRGQSRMNNTKASLFYIASSREVKREQESNQKLMRAIRKPYDAHGAQSEIAIWRQELLKNSRAHSSLLDMFRLTNQGAAGMVESLEDEMNNFSAEKMPVHRSILEYFRILNKLSAKLSSANTQILPDTVLNYRNHVLGNLIIQDDGTTLNNVYHNLYDEYVLSMDNLRYQELQAIESELVSYLINNPTTETFNLDYETFIKTFFGRMLYEQSIGIGIHARHDDVDIEKIKTRDQILQIIQEDKEFKEKSLYKQSWEIKNSLIEEDISYQKIEGILRSNNITDKMKTVIKKQIKDFHKRTLLEQDEKQILDTYSISRLVQMPEGLDIKNKSLFNIYSQVTNFLNLSTSILTSDDVAVEIGKILESQGLVIKNNRLHTAAVDVKINLETIYAFAEIQKIVEAKDPSINIFENLEEITKKGEAKSTKFKDMVMALSDKKKRQNYIVFDTETQVTKRNLPNGIYEISYTYFDKDGNEVPVQKYIVQNLGKGAIAFLTNKGYTKKEINNIRNEIVKNGFGHNKKVLEEFINIAKDKIIIGQNVQGDIDDINKQYSHILANEILNNIKKDKVQENELVKMMRENSWEEVSEKIRKSDKLKDVTDREVLIAYRKELVNNFRRNFREKFRYGNEINYTDQELSHYTEKMTQMFKSFLEADGDEDALKTNLINILSMYSKGKQITMNDLNPILEEYKRAINGIKQNGYVLKTHQVAIDEFGNIVLQELPMIDNNGNVMYQKIYKTLRKDKNGNLVERELKEEHEFEGYDIFSEILIKQEAFYSVMDMLNETIHIGEFSFKEHNTFNFLEDKLDSEDINHIKNVDFFQKEIVNNPDSKITFHYKNYLNAKEKGDDYLAFRELKRAYRLKDTQNKTNYLDENLFAFGDDFYIADMNELNRMLEQKSQEKGLGFAMQLDDSIISKRLKTLVDLRYDLSPEIRKQTKGITDKKEIERITQQILSDGLANQKRKEETVSKFYKAGWEIANAKDVNRSVIAKALGVHRNSDFIDVLVQEWHDNYQKLKQKGWENNYSDGSLANKVDHEEKVDHLFKRMAFNMLLETDKKYINRYLFAILGNEVDYDPYSYDPDNTAYKDYLKERNRITNPLKVITVHDETNKMYFDNVKNEFKNKIFNAAMKGTVSKDKGFEGGDWKEVFEYINGRPLTKEEESTRPAIKFRNKFNRILNELIKNGIQISEKDFHIDDKGQIQYSRKVGKTFYWEENNEAIKKLFIEEVISEMWEDINDNLYVNQIRTTVRPDIDLEQVTTWNEYISNIKRYNGSKSETSYQLEIDVKENIDRETSYLFDKENKIRNLSRYQKSLIDIREAFVYYDERGRKKYNYESMYKSLTEGFLSKVYKITMVTNLSKEEMEEYKWEREQPDFDPNSSDPDLLASLAKNDEDFRKKVELLRNQNSPVVKFLDIESADQLQTLIENADKFVSVGLTNLNDMQTIGKISYADYELPKGLSRATNNIVRLQKFMAVTNPNFYLNMMVSGLHKNYSAIIGDDRNLFKNSRFFSEGVRTKSLLSSTNKALKYHTEFLADINKSINDLRKIEESMTASGKYNILDLHNHRKPLLEQMNERLVNIDDFLEVIYDQGQTEFDRASTLYEELVLLRNTIQEAHDVLKEDSTGFHAYKDQIEKLFRAYMGATFLQKTIMSDKRFSHVEQDANFSKNKEKLLDTLNLMNVIHKAEKAGVMYTDFHKSGGKEAVDIYDYFNKETEREAKENAFLMGMEKMVDGMTFLQKGLIGRINKFNRVHGILLDMYVNNLSEDEAIQQSLYRFFNYSNRTKFEHDAILFFPYMSYAVRDLQYQLDMLKNWRYMDFMYNIAQGMETMYRSDHNGDHKYSTNRFDYAQHRGWIPLGKDFGIKIGNPMFSSFSLLDDPFGATWQRSNPILKAIDNVITGKPNYKDLPMGQIAGRISHVMNRDSNRPYDLLPSVFYKRYDPYTGGYRKHTPYRYRVNYDYRNLNRELFFPDGSRRTPSKNPLTTAKNTLYRARVNASINRRLRGR